MTKLTIKQIQQAKRQRACATCGRALSGSETGMGYAECLWCRIERHKKEREESE